MLNLSKALKAEEVSGRIYVDLEQLLEMMYEASNNSSVAATEAKDPALGLMVMGMATLCNSLDAVLTAKKLEHGLTDQPHRCGSSEEHKRHMIMRQRKIYWCPGVA